MKKKGDKNVKEIEHVRISCPYCDSKNIAINTTINQKSTQNNKILKVERFFKCKNCTNSFKSVERLT